MKGSRNSPIGPIWVEVDDVGIVASGWGDVSGGAHHPLLDTALDELDAYFAGQLTTFSVPIHHGRAGLNAKVMDALCAIPFGETRRYGDLAKDLDAPAQAIGQACGANSIPIFVPCHRILSATGLGGFSAPGGVETKVWLLKHEGAASLLI